jgi:hypothetical protein
MTTRSLLAALLCLLPVLALAAGPAPIIPNTPAGTLLATWLAAFNSGDRERIKAFDDAHISWLTLDQAMGIRSYTGGYELLSVGKGGKLWIEFSAKEKVTSTLISGKLVVMPDDLASISVLGLGPTDAETDASTVSAEVRDQLIGDSAKMLARFYVFPDVGQRMASTIRAEQKRGDYRDITDSQILARRLTDELLAISHDKHISVRFSQNIAPPDPTDLPDRRPDIDPGFQQRLKARNCGFEKIEHLDPNIGYLKLDEFAEPRVCSATANAAMTLLADSDAVIFDLRENHGGSPRMVALLCSYLLEVPTHLGDFYDRQKNTTEQSWTFPYLPGKNFVAKPVFVLTSSETFSGAEEFSYDLKNLKRATLVGETTGGGAHIVAPHRLGDHFVISIPFGKYISPITGTDWEVTGVEPDVKVAAADALEEALKRAREQDPSAPSAR